MRESKQNQDINTKAQLSSTVQPETENHQNQPLIQMISTVEKTPTVQNHAMMLSRAIATQPTHKRNLLLQLQRQYGNSYVQRVINLAKKADDRKEIDSIGQRSPTNLNAIVQRQEPQNKTAEEQQEKQKEDTTQVLQQGAATILENLDSQNPKFKELQTQVKETAKNEAGQVWQDLSPVDKGALIGFGALSLGTVGTAFASDERGRAMVVDLLDGKNLAAPLTLIPYMPISSFQFKRPEIGAANQGIVDLKASLTVTPYLELLRKRYSNVPPLSATVDLNFGFDTTTEHLQFKSGTFNLSIYQGINLSGGVGSGIGIRPLPELVPNPQGGFSTVPTRFPQPETPTLVPNQSTPGFEFMLKIDLAKIKGLPNGLDRIFRVF
jgi:hypothetical protein